ncbi:KpsF/GutQ family sugar-phosphate isomerase [Falsiroseomonas algicola]|uniref:KpsF/GutQ family sugar-phosphate isomerase n=1 Tax=Falsiroseomonas algicola TaxID=2716930 RepID=UPI002E2C41F4|nr:KpsF/GutQ family sugar-phosphate isomerase [Falsiroseomonas algicola]
MSDDHLRDSLRRTVQLEADGLAALRDALDGTLGDTLIAAVRMMLEKTGRCVVTGMGKSGHVGRKIAATLASTGTASHFVHPAEASHGDLGMIRPEDVILALSWSGGAPELASIIGYAHRFGVKLIAITSVADSPLGKAADYPLILPRMPEACPNGLAPTTSTTMQLAVGDAFAMGLLEARGFSAADFRVFHPGGKLGAQLLRASDLMHTDLPLVPQGATLAEAIVTMTSKPFGTGGVVDGEGRLLGVITDGDIRRAFRKGFVDRPATEAMTRKPLVAAPDQLAPDLVKTMNERRITSMFVVVEGVPRGVIHLHDLLRAGVV